MGADQDVDAALAEALDRLALLGGAAEARDVLDRERVVGEALAEGAVVLLGEDRRRREHEHLLAVGGGLERGAQRDLGLAVADVAADQPVHRPRLLHVRLDRLDRLALVGGLGVGEALLELALPVAVGRERVARGGAGARRRAASSSPAISCAAWRARAFIVSQRVPPSFESGGCSPPAPT